MKNFLLLLLFLPQLSQAKPNLIEPLVDLQDRIAEQVFLQISEVDENLKNDEAVYEFYFETYNEVPMDIMISYSIDERSASATLQNNVLIVPSTAGKHVFQFYYNSTYYEVYSDSLQIEARHRNHYIVYLESADYEIMSEKPVIYLYPEARLEVSVKIDIHGENIFTYPVYGDGWNFTAEPNGDLIFGDETYNYLFWEATTHSALSPQQRSTGFFVTGENAVEFLEEKLKLAGLNSKEKADFITYWGPRLAQNKLNFIHFEFNDACNAYADLSISPKPDNVYRIYMLWGSVQTEFPVVEQKIETIDRSGFSVLEWGGQETHIRQNVGQKIN